MKIADLKKNNDQSIYKQILETNEINENCTLLREAIARDETQYEDVTVVPLTTQGIYRDQTVITITRLEVWR